MVSCNRFYNNSTKDSQIIRHQKLVPHTFATDCFQRYRIILKDTSKYKNKSTHHTTQDYNASSKTIYSFVMHYYISLKKLRAMVALTFHYPFLHLDTASNRMKMCKWHLPHFCAVTSKSLFIRWKWLWNYVLLEEILDDCLWN